MEKEWLAEGAARGRNELNEFQEEQEGQCGWNVATRGGVSRVSLSQGPDHGRPCRPQKGVWILFQW